MHYILVEQFNPSMLQETAVLNHFKYTVEPVENGHQCWAGPLFPQK